MELPEEDLTGPAIERWTGVQTLHRCLPLPILSLPCPEVNHGRHKQDPHMPNPTRGTSRRLKPATGGKDGGRWFPLPSMGQGKLWPPARASKHLSSQRGLAAPLPPAGWAGLGTLQVVRVSTAGGAESPKTRQCGTEGRATQDSDPRHTSPSTASKPTCFWVEFRPNCMAN